LLLILAVVAALVFEVPAASAAKIKMAFPGPVTTFSLPYLVAQKNGWMNGLEVEDVHVTGDANAMRVLLSGNADIALVGDAQRAGLDPCRREHPRHPFLAADR
jgi:ABC-type nitrate/sulfonate/bicarbonate transport system substrate-binding protein